MQIFKNIKDFLNPPQPLPNKYTLGERVILEDFNLTSGIHFPYPEEHLIPGGIVTINHIHCDSESVSYRFEESITDMLWPEGLINHRVSSNQDFLQILVENGYLAQFLTKYLKCGENKEFVQCHTPEFSQTIQNWLEKNLKTEKGQKYEYNR